MMDSSRLGVTGGSLGEVPKAPRGMIEKGRDYVRWYWDDVVEGRDCFTNNGLSDMGDYLEKVC